MATVVNECDLELQANPRFDIVGTNYVSLAPSSPNLSINSTSNTISLTSVAYSGSGVFTCGTADIVVGDRVLVSGNITGNIVLPFYISTGTYYYVTATNVVNSTTRQFTLSTTKNGSAITTTGTTLTGLTFKVPKNIISIKANLNGNLRGVVSWSIDPATVTYITDSLDSNSIIISLDNTLPVINNVKTSIDKFTVTATLTYLGLTNTSQVEISKVYDGLSASLDKSSLILSAAGDNSGIDYTSATATMKIYIGANEDTDNTIDPWTFAWTLPENSGITVSLDQDTNQPILNEKTITITNLNSSFREAEIYCTATRIGWPTIIRYLKISTNRYSTSSAIVNAFKRSATAVTNKPGSFIYQFTTGTVTPIVAKISAVSRASNVTTITTSSAHGLTSGLDENGVSKKVTVICISDPTYSVINAVIKAGTSGTTLIYDNTGSNQTSTVATGGVSNSANYINGWSKSIPTTPLEPIYITSVTAYNTVESGDYDIVDNEDWSSPILFGQTDIARTIYVYKRTASSTTPDEPTTGGTVDNDPVYNFSNDTLTATFTDDVQGVDAANKWSRTIPSDISKGAYLWVSFATVIGDPAGTDVIEDGEWSTPALLASNVPQLSVTADSYIFVADAANAITGTVKLTANKTNTTSPVAWSTNPSVALFTAETGGAQLTIPAPIPSNHPDVVYLRAANFGTNTSVAITAAISSLSLTDTTTIARVSSGENAAIVVFGNPSHPLNLDSSGNVVTYAASGTTIQVIQAGVVRTITAVTTTGTNITAGSVSSGLDTTTVTIGNHSNILTDTATVQYTITYRKQSDTEPAATGSIIASQSVYKNKPNSVVQLIAYVRASSGNTPPAPGGTGGNVGVYNFSSKSFSTSPTSISGATTYTWQLSPPSGTDPVWVSTTTAVGLINGSNTNTLSWSTPVLFVQNGSTGAAGIVQRIAYQSVAQTGGSPTYLSSTIGPTTLPGANWLSTAPTATVGNVIWYIYGQYNPNASALQGIAANTTVWSTPIAASIFQDIKSDNWNGANPPTGGTFGGGTLGYYLNKSEGSIYVQSAYVKGTIVAGSVIGDTVTLSSGTALNTIASNATTALANANTALTNANAALANANSAISQLSTKLQADSNYTLTGVATVQDSGAIKVGSITWNSTTGAITGGTGVAFTENGITAAKNGTATFSITSSGDATFAGSLSAATGTFAGSLTAATGTFTGSLTAATGSFVGTLSVGNGNSIFKVNSDGSIHSGHDLFASAPFKVTNSGGLTATSATITGTLTTGSIIASTATLDTANGTTLNTVASNAATAISQLSTKLQADSNYTLTGVATVQDSGAIKVGSITWNSTTGAITGGTGVAFTENGITAAKNGTATFSITSSGDATFAGSLSAATGTFAGTITAGALIVETAASTVISGAASGATSLQPGTAASDVNSNTTTISGNKIRTGIIESTSYSYTSGNTFSTSGTQIDLGTGLIRSKSFLIDSSGAATFSGTINASVFQTATSNARFTLNASSDNALKGYDSNSNLRTEIYASLGYMVITNLGSTIAITGKCATGTGVFGESTAGGDGVKGKTTTGNGVLGEATGTSGIGVKGNATGTSGVGVEGRSTNYFGGAFYGGSTSAPLYINANGSLPTTGAISGALCVVSNKLYFHNGTVWKEVQFV